MDKSLLGRIDELIAESLIEKLKGGKATASDIQAARQYLAHHGFQGGSVASHQKSDTNHPLRILSEIDLDEVRDAMG